MKQTLLKIAGVSALAAGIVLGQNAPAQNQRPRPTPRAGMGAFLNLTDAQKQQAESIFAAARESSRAVSSQLRDNRKALADAVKSGATAEIDRLSSAMGPLFAQTAAIHAKAFAQFYAILTPEQQDKLGNRVGRMMDGMGPFGFRSPSRRSHQ